MRDTTTRFCTMDSPIGPLVLAGNGTALTELHFPTSREKRRIQPHWIEDDAPFAEIRQQLIDYFAGKLTEFAIDLEPSGNPFQQAVWSALEKIPYGETVSYGDIARQIGEPVSASRAVGAANGANPLPIIIPCHRVVGADGSLTGFGGGLEIKQFLLDLEFSVKPPAGTLFAAAGSGLN